MPGSVATFKRDVQMVRAPGCEACTWVPPEALLYRPGSDGLLHAHHIVPVACGGPDHPSNLLLLCPNCHAIAHRLGKMGGRVNRSTGYRDWSGPRTRDEALAAFAIVTRPAEHAVFVGHKHDLGAHLATVHELALKQHRGVSAVLEQRERGTTPAKGTLPLRKFAILEELRAMHGTRAPLPWHLRRTTAENEITDANLRLQVAS